MRTVLGIAAAILTSTSVWSQTAATTPAKPEFEVASIRPSGPVTPGQLTVGLHIDGAQIRGHQFALKDYLQMAYRLKNYQVTGPDWIASDRFDISAKLPDGATRAQVPEMLAALLISRFHLATHRETKPFPVYALTVAKTGLKMDALPADPDDADDPLKGAVDVKAGGSRGGMSIDLGKGSSFSFSDNTFVGKKLSMTALADMLARFEDRPVVDMTGLKGNYDFKLECAPEDFRAMMIRSAIAAGVTLPPQALALLDNASDGSLQAALQAVGLKLESRKAPIEMLVVDHADKVPSDN